MVTPIKYQNNIWGSFVQLLQQNDQKAVDALLRQNPAVLDSILISNTNDSVNSMHQYYSEGIRLYQLNHWEAALVFFEYARKNFKSFNAEDNARLHLYLACVYEKLNRKADAILNLEEGLNFEAVPPEIQVLLFCHLGNVHEDIKLAIAAFKKVLEVNFNSDELHAYWSLVVAALLTHRGLYQTAMEVCDQDFKYKMDFDLGYYFFELKKICECQSEDRDSLKEILTFLKQRKSVVL